MDDYVTKPISPRELFAAIGRVTKSLESQDFSDAESSLLEDVGRFSASSSVLNLDETLELLDGDHQAVKQLVDLFFLDLGKHLNNLKSQAAAGDFDALAATAHTIKGSAGVFNATPVVMSAQALETAARKGDLEGGRKVLPELLEALNRLATALRKHCVTNT